MYGKTASEATRKKVSESLKGHIGYWTGKKQPKDVVELRAAKRRGKHWFNNGIRNVTAFECPEGFVKGRINWSK